MQIPLTTPSAPLQSDWFPLTAAWVFDCRNSLVCLISFSSLKKRALETAGALEEEESRDSCVEKPPIPTPLRHSHFSDVLGSGIILIIIMHIQWIDLHCIHLVLFLDVASTLIPRSVDNGDSIRAMELIPIFFSHSVSYCFTHYYCFISLYLHIYVYFHLRDTSGRRLWIIKRGIREQRALCWANNSEASEVTFQDGEGAQPLRTIHQKGRKEQGKQACTEVGREPSHARAAISPAVHARSLCECAEVRRAPTGAARPERIRLYRCEM